MPNISARNLFHFTKSIENMKGILDSGFRPSWCKEHLVDATTRKPITFSIPMVSFCDIPLAIISEHTRRYKGYGIGMRKEWGLKNGLSPVMYIHNDSLLATELKLARTLERMYRGSDDPSSDDFSQLLVCYLKKHYGFDPVSKQQNVKFYNEREWRHIPKTFLTEAKTGGIREDSATRMTFDNLRFDISDIVCLFVEKEDERPELISAIRSTKESRYTSGEVDILVSKIISVEQVGDDF